MVRLRSPRQTTVILTEDEGEHKQEVQMKSVRNSPARVTLRLTPAPGNNSIFSVLSFRTSVA